MNVIKRIFVILIIIIVMILLFISIWIVTAIIGDEKRFQDEYDINYTDILDFDCISYIEKKDYINLSEFKVDNASFMDVNTYADCKPEIDEYDFTKYYLDNNCCYLSSNNATKYSYYVYGTNTNCLDFIFGTAQTTSFPDNWYVKKDYSFPEVNSDSVESIILCSTENQPHDASILRRINIDENSIRINDRKTITQVIESNRLNNCNFSYLNQFVNNNTYDYLILVKFEKGVIYQCLGVLQ